MVDVIIENLKATVQLHKDVLEIRNKLDAIGSQDLGRKPIQILRTEGNGREHALMYALCDDGTIWYRNCIEGAGHWQIHSEQVPRE